MDKSNQPPVSIVAEVQDTLHTALQKFLFREVTEQRMLDAGFQRFLVKPFNSDDLIETVLRLIKNYQPSTH